MVQPHYVMRSGGCLSRQVVCTAVLAITLGGCKVGPDYVPPDLPVPDAWHLDLVDGLND